MKNRILLVLLSFILAGSMVGPETVQSQEQKKIFKWRFQSFVPESDADYFVNMKGIKRLIEEGSGGQVQVETFALGVLSAPEAIVDAVTMGAIEGGDIIAGMASDRVPSSFGSELPYGARNGSEWHEVHYAGALLDIMRQEYAARDLYLLAPAFNGRLCFQSTFPVNAATDFKGKKIWTTPNTIWLTKLGASPTDIPGMDMYMALKLGTVDGITWTVGELDVSNLKEVVKYVMLPTFLPPTTHFIVNMKAWNTLGPDLRQKIQKHVDAHIIELAQQYASYDGKAEQVARQFGVKFVELPASEVEKLRRLSREFWNEVGGMSPTAGKMIEAYKAYLKRKQIAW